MFILKIGVSVWVVLDPEHGVTFKLVYNCILACSLIFGVLLMKRMISRIKQAEPNNKLVVVHITNFAVWVLLFGIFCYGYNIRALEQSGSTVQHVFILLWIVENLFILYVDLFLMWLLLGFAAQSKHAKQSRSNIVELMNKDIIKN